MKDKEYKVFVSVDECYSVVVKAKSEKQASEKALKEIEVNSFDNCRVENGEGINIAMVDEVR